MSDRPAARNGVPRFCRITTMPCVRFGFRPVHVKHFHTISGSHRRELPEPVRRPRQADEDPSRGCERLHHRIQRQDKNFPATRTGHPIEDGQRQRSRIRIAVPEPCFDWILNVTAHLPECYAASPHIHANAATGASATRSAVE